MKREEEIDDNLAYNFIPVSSNPTVAMMSQSMASIHRSSPSSPPTHSHTPTDRNHRQTTSKKKKSFRSKQQSNHHSATSSRSSKVKLPVTFQKEPEEHIFNDNGFNSNRTTINDRRNNYKSSQNEGEVAYREEEENVAFLGRNFLHHYRTDGDNVGESDDLSNKDATREKYESSTESSSSLLLNRPVEDREVRGSELIDEEQTRINKEILFPLFDSILSQSESRDLDSNSK